MKLEGLKENKGITVLALTITIIVLLILSGITIVGITGENGIIQNAVQAKEETEISEEKEIVEQATVQTMGNNNRGIIEKDKLQTQLDSITGEGKTIVTEDKEEGGFFVKFIESGRIYKVSQTGEVKYLGIEETLLKQAEIIASPESNLTPELIQHVDLTVKTLIDIGDVDYTLVCAWNKDKNNAPEDIKFKEESLTGEGRIKKAGIDSIDTEQGEYYLWVRVAIGEIEKEECFGPYAIKDHTTLISTATEKQSESGFLGNEKIQRRNIKSIKIQNSLQGHSVNEENCWDVSQSQDGRYLAWYEETADGKYEVTIAGKGGVVANTDSSYLFSYIGYNVDDEVTITGLENFDTGLVTKMNFMFYYSKVKSLELKNFYTKNVINMESMFNQCSNLTVLDITSFDTSSVTNMKNMFGNCKNLRSLNLDNLNVKNVKTMEGMFRECTNLLSLSLENLNAEKLTNMNYMFLCCSNLEKIDLNNFCAQNITSMFQIFAECNLVKNIDLGGLNTINVTNMGWMFQACEKLEEINFGKTFYTDNVESMQYMFQRCNSLIKLDLSNFNTQNVTYMSTMFKACTSLKELNIGNFNTQNVEKMDEMFYDCAKLEKLDISNFDMTNVTNYGNIFKGVTTNCNIILNNKMSQWMDDNGWSSLNMRTIV